MTNNQYKDGTRDYFRYVDYGLKDSVELSDLLAVLTSDGKDDKIEMNDGTLENFLPTKKFKLSIDKAQILATNTVNKADEGKIVSEIEWTFPKDNAFKGDLAMLDIIQNNNWKRPIYFSVGVSNDSYIGLDKYLYMEGAAYRLLPIKAETETAKYENTNTMLAFKHYQNFEFAGYKTAKYLDPESRRVLQGTWSFANTLTTNLLKENQTAMAKKVVDKSLSELPLRNWSISDTVNKVSLIANLNQLKMNIKAIEISQKTAKYVAQEFDYILSLSPEQQMNFLDDIKRGMYVLQSLQEIADKSKQSSLNKLLNEKIIDYNSRFSQSLG
ncbi:MAG: hypothetical protein EOP00_29480 [Pedobacter sp.]|nr:MAG: hypothetical protein EOP00_29480 [Pedobacter sp.]